MKTLSGVSEAQRELFFLVGHYVESFNRGPTFKEVADYFEVSIPAARVKMRRLKNAKAIWYPPGQVTNVTLRTLT